MTEAPTASPEASPVQPTPETTATPETPPEDSPERTFTQDDLKKIAANEKREGKKSAQTEILERAQQYGAESLDDVFSILETHSLIQSEMETDADKAEKARVKAEERATAAEERYTNTLREYALRDALRDSGINPERLRSAMRLADLSALEVDKEDNVSGIEDVVEAVQKEAPEFFGEQARPRVSAPQTNGTGVSRPNTNEDPKTAFGQSFLGWLTEPVPEEKNSWP